MNKSQQVVYDSLRQAGVVNYRGGIQLESNQYDKEYSVSVNFNGTGVHIKKSLINPEELVDDEVIKIHNTFECKI